MSPSTYTGTYLICAIPAEFAVVSIFKAESLFTITDIIPFTYILNNKATSLKLEY